MEGNGIVYDHERRWAWVRCLFGLHWWGRQWSGPADGSLLWQTCLRPGCGKRRSRYFEFPPVSR